jgi:hypothetical protein|tara:strand:+ start:400 stop:729 length:330 start_codon:yes stop_codon:yes gene_type:complete
MARQVREVGTFVLNNSNLQVRYRNEGHAVEMVILDAFGTCVAIVPKNNCTTQNAVIEGRLFRLNNGRIANWKQKSAEIAKLANTPVKTKTKAKAKTIKANVKPKLKSVA